MVNTKDTANRLDWGYIVDKYIMNIIKYIVNIYKYKIESELNRVIKNKARFRLMR